VQTLDKKLESLILELPDEKGARHLLERLSDEHAAEFRKLTRRPGLLSDILALGAWSPLLATTIEQNPDYISWLGRERVNPRVRTCEELKESLARFALTNSTVSPQVLLARFRRRELLRIYLHDIRRTHTMVETTEELSNLADAVLDYALSLARQELDNRYGLPRQTDERGRTGTAAFCIMALGKLGSHELNYASDIDLVFLYSDEGTTSGLGQRGEVSNREYFVKLAESVVRLAGRPAGEVAAYRVDVRLRPHGRDGALACSLDEATHYYRHTAQAWELQTLIRSRAAAGSASLFSRFAAAVRSSVFRPEVAVHEALASVCLAKQKIDRHIESRSGFNVKLGRGGIREIEFISQALQLAHGGTDAWLRVPHTLVSLGRLADREFITDQELTELSDAYVFLRMIEHRLQMEHGLQTHLIPDNEKARSLLAKRMNFAGPSALDEFEVALKLHTGNVRRVYDRVFSEESRAEPVGQPGRVRGRILQARSSDGDATAAFTAARVFFGHLKPETREVTDVPALARLLRRIASESLNAHRSLSITARIASSLDKSDERIEVSEDNLTVLLHLCGTSDFFGDMIAANPGLITSLSPKPETGSRRDFRTVLRASIDGEKSLHAELAAFRRTWAALLVGISARDASGEISVLEANRLQTDLATASINVAYLIARREMARRYGSMAGGPRLAIFGLGRLGSGGVDYGSDLDIIITYDSLAPSPIGSLTQEECYSRVAELIIAALSSVTREGYLYRVDLRLRPHGKDGPLVTGTQAFVDYVKESAAIWEWLAYVKLRSIAGDLELGRMIETHARHAIHEKARKFDHAELKHETRRVRDRLEKEKELRARATGIDIKYGAGGMLDVYFATRYLQLRDDVPDEGDDRSTQSTLERLEAEGSLSLADTAVLSDGYALLRSVDHQLRLIVGRSARLPALDHPASRDLAFKLGFRSPGELNEALAVRMKAIRETYNRITS
jgi:glutamate-ammonia-ligase adenylyltransferase